jgi:methylthioribose-1-phosphate isomerase
MSLRPVQWIDGTLQMLDQRRLPQQTSYLSLRSSGDVAIAIRDMAVRGAPAIGIAAAYGMVLAVLNGEDLTAADEALRNSRPTAVNLFWALDRMRPAVNFGFATALAEAQAIEREDVEMNLAIGRNGLELVPNGARILTICNTGALATAGHGTALGIIRSAHQAGEEIFVTSCETRPRLQGLKLTAFELLHDGIPFRSIADSAAGHFMQSGEFDLVVAGADRIAANGDTANKIGTYTLAVLARHHGVPFVIAAPTSTLDPTLPSGRLIPIEEREADEVTHIEGVAVAPPGTPVSNPGFDITPGDLISAIVTESGVFRPPFNFASEPIFQ